jgi:hypothetical protein
MNNKIVLIKTLYFCENFEQYIVRKITKQGF